MLKRLMAFRNALAGEEAKCADARIKLLEKVIDDIANAPRHDKNCLYQHFLSMTLIVPE